MILESVLMAWFQRFPGWDRLHGLACMMLGLYSLCTCVTQYLKSEKQECICGDHTSRPHRAILRFSSVVGAGMRASCILAAWLYALLAMDLAATHIESWTTSANDSSGAPPSSTLGIL